MERTLVKFASTLHRRLAARLVSDPETGCINWTGALSRDGYGLIKEGGRGSTNLGTHRLAYEIANGAVPAGLVLDHLCRNRRCCNPEHMEIVTRRENTLRGESPAARHAKQTQCKRDHAFTPDNTYVTPNGRRNCRACRRLKDAEK